MREFSPSIAIPQATAAGPIATYLARNQMHFVGELFEVKISRRQTPVVVGSKEGQNRGAEDNRWGSIRLDKPYLQIADAGKSNSQTLFGGGFTL